MGSNRKQGVLRGIGRSPPKKALLKKVTPKRMLGRIMWGQDERAEDLHKLPWYPDSNIKYRFPEWELCPTKSHWQPHVVVFRGLFKGGRYVSLV